MHTSDHKRDDTNRYRSVCGAGYDYPSSISLRDDWNEVTCSLCLSTTCDRNNGEMERK